MFRRPYLFLLFLLAACTTESYESGDSKLSQMRADFVVAYTNSKAQVVSAMTDNGDSLLFDAPATQKWIATPDSTYRLLLYYEPAENGKTHPMYFNQMLTLNLRKTSATTQQKTDPLTLESVWMSKNRRFLNMGLVLKTGAHEQKALQTLGVWCDSIEERDDKTRCIRLTIYHDQGNVPEYYSAKYYASIPLGSFNLSQGDEIALSVNTYEGMATYTIAY